MASVSFISLSHPPPIKFYFLTTKYFQIIDFICSSIVWQSASSSCSRYHSLSHSPPQQNFRQPFFSFRKVRGYLTSLLSWFTDFKGLQSLIECIKIRSNGRLLNYLTEQESNYMPNKVFAHKDCRGDYINPLRKITEARKCDNCVNPTDQRQKVLIGKHIDSFVEKLVL